MIILGVVLLVLGLLLPLHVLFIVGIVLLGVGLVLAVASVSGRPIGGRTWW